MSELVRAAQYAGKSGVGRTRGKRRIFFRSVRVFVLSEDAVTSGVHIQSPMRLIDSLDLQVDTRTHTGASTRFHLYTRSRTHQVDGVLRAVGMRCANTPVGWCVSSTRFSVLVEKTYSPAFPVGGGPLVRRRAQRRQTPTTMP